ncbi:MAG: LptE family protein, partial [Paludibacteraceae bacterium]|nr:LptE family protein [Paludibacteraceae bacterium]
ESLRDIYAKQTRLTQVTNNGDIELEGEITGYDITPMSISDDAIAAETRLTITINVRYSNKANSDKDFERSFSAFQNFSNTQTLTQVQEQLCQTIVDEIVETIFNQTVADW